MRHGLDLSLTGQGLDNHRQIGFIFSGSEYRSSTHAIKRLVDDITMDGVKVTKFVLVSTDDVRWYTLRKAQCKELFVAISDAAWLI